MLPTYRIVYRRQRRMFETDEEYRQRIGRIELGAGQDFRGLDFRSRGQVTRNFVIAFLVTLGVTALAGWLCWPNLGHACLAIVGCALRELHHNRNPAVSRSAIAELAIVIVAPTVDATADYRAGVGVANGDGCDACRKTLDLSRNQAAIR